MSRNVQKQMYVPLLNVLKKMEPEDRIILMSHFNDVTTDYLCATITRLLRDQKIPFEKKLVLREKLMPYEKKLRYLAKKTKSSKKMRRKVLSQIGGGPMNYLIDTALTKLLDLFV